MMRRGLVALALILSGSFAMATVLPQSAIAEEQPKPPTCDEKGMILSLKPWYYGQTEGPNCTIKSPGDNPEAQRNFIWGIAITIVEDLLQIVGYIAVGFIIYGGFVFMTSSGSPEKAAAGRRVIMNAVIGLVIAMAAVALVNLVVRRALGIQP